MQKIIIITGPTAVGKTKCSISIAKSLKTDIINGDAYQVYKDMNIGTAKIKESEKEGITHHLLDFVDPKEEFNVATYQTLVRDKINDLVKENKIPLIVGGSGLYLESIFLNYEFSEKKRDTSFEEELKDLTDEELYAKLVSLDKDKALTIHPHNRKRVLRAIEIAMENSGPKPLKKHEYLYEPLVIFLNDDREVLYDRINKRVDQMMEEGLEQEARSFYDDQKGPLISKTAASAIGYKELFNYFNGTYSKEDAVNKIKQASRNYAKRQLTWFRNKEYATLVMIDSVHFEKTVNEVEMLINEFLKN